MYPVDNYAELTSVENFLGGPDHKGITLDDLHPEDLLVVDEHDVRDRNFNAWALVDSSRRVVAAWLYDRTFSGKHSGSRPPKRWLKIERALPNQFYRRDWFDTWKGAFLREGIGAERSDKNGILRSPLPRFPKSDKPAVLAAHSDGNDIALYLAIPRR